MKLRSSIFFTATITFVAFFSVIYISCTTAVLSPFSCENHICRNGGHCTLGKCVCPTGWQDDSCTTKWNTKFLGHWKFHETVIATDSVKYLGITDSFNVSLDSTSSPNAFFIKNWLNNPLYNNVLCVIDTTNITFRISPYTPTTNGNYHIIDGTGTLDIGTGIINGVYYNNYRNMNGFVQHDTLGFTIKRTQ